MLGTTIDDNTSLKKLSLADSSASSASSASSVSSVSSASSAYKIIHIDGVTVFV